MRTWIETEPKPLPGGLGTAMLGDADADADAVGYLLALAMIARVGRLISLARLIALPSPWQGTTDGLWPPHT